MVSLFFDGVLMVRHMARTGNCAPAPEAGFVLIFLAIAATAVIALLALAVDSYRLSTSHSQERSVAQAASLAALERYREVTVPVGLDAASEYSFRLSAAIRRAEEVAGLPANSLIGTPSTQNAAVGDFASNAAGKVTPGAYIFEEPNGVGGCGFYNSQGGRNSPSTKCPCGGSAGSEWVGPCFLENDASSIDASAFDVQMNTKTSSPIPFFFGKGIGQPSSAVRAPGRAAMVPRHGIYAVDMSASMAAETHRPLRTLNPSSSEVSLASQYVFQIDPSSPVKCAANGAKPCVANGSNCLFAGGATGDQQLTWYTYMEPNRPATGYYPRAKHYRNDYTCRILDLDGDGTDEHYLIDTALHKYDDNGDGTSDGYYRGPEPLSSILAGIHEALVTIEDRQVAGDQIAVFAFDQAVVPLRLFAGTHPGQTSFEDLKKITDLPVEGNAKTAETETRLNAGFFPRWEANTDIPEAVMKSGDLLREMANSASSQNYVAMFTDGISTCQHQCGDSDGSTGECANPVWNTFLYKDASNKVKLSQDLCRSPQTVPFDHRKTVEEGGGPYTDGTGWWYGASWNFHINSINEVSTLIAGNRTEYPMSQFWWMKQAGLPSYVDQRIAFHAVLFGQLAQPHTVLRKHSSDPNRCMDEADARRSGNSYVWNDWDDYWIYNRSCYETLEDSSTGVCPYLQGTYEIYRHWVRPTGGFFVAVRPPCDMTKFSVAYSTSMTNAQCRTGALNTRLDNICKTKGLWPGGPVRNEPRLVTAGIVDDLAGKNYYGPGQMDFNWVKDSDQEYRPPRITCDTSCRTIEEQVKEFIRKIYDQNPYVLVDPR